MSAALDHLAARVVSDPTFLANPLAEYARSEGLNDDGLVAALGCTRADLTRLRLCGVPRADPQLFRSDIDAIATRFGIAPRILTEVVRRGQALARVRAVPVPTDAGAVLAARDDPPKEPTS